MSSSYNDDSSYAESSSSVVESEASHATSHSRPKKSHRPPNYAIAQQRMWGCHPVKSGNSVGLTCGILFVPYVLFGVLLLSASSSVVDAEVDYSSCLPTLENGVYVGTACSAIITVPEDMEPPIYMYYKLSGIYQGHRLYVKSRSDEQLAGDLDSMNVEDCSPREYIEGGDDDDPSTYLYPCGLAAGNVFNDTLWLETTGGAPIEMTDSGISYKHDREKFGAPEAGATIGVNEYNIDVEDANFQVWMRLSAFPTFQKLYRIIPGPLAAGTYALSITANYPMPEGGKKAVVLSTTSWAGGRNDILGWVYIGLGAAALLMVVVFPLAAAIIGRRLDGSEIAKFRVDVR